MDHQTEIVIVGAGLAGLSAAVMLSQATDLSITVLEQQPMCVSAKPDRASRPISLAYASARILQSLQLWAALEAVATPIEEVQVTHAGAFGGVHFSAQTWQLPALGYVIPIDFLQQALRQAVEESPSITLQSASTVTAIHSQTDGLQLTVRTPQGEHTQWATMCVAADGGQSTIRTLCHIPVFNTGPAIKAMVGACQLAMPHQNKAYQRFLSEKGVLAVLPLAESRSGRFVWSMSVAQAELMSTRSSAYVLNELQSQCRGYLTITAAESQGMFSIQPSGVKALTSGRVVLLGNAAVTQYPLAAQGFNLALRDAAALVELLVEQGATPECLTAYQAWRGREQQQLQGFTRSMYDGFSLMIPPIHLLRGAVLAGMEYVPSIKKRLAMRLLGLSGRVPAFVRGITPAQLKEECHGKAS